MLRNYLKIALRTLWKQKGTTAINVLGLAAGMAVCLLVGLLLWDQVTHDDFHPGAERLYRLILEVEGRTNDAATPAGVAPALRDGAVGVETLTLLKRTRPRLNLVVENQGVEARGYYASPSFFELFGFELVAGSAAEALSAPQTAVITEELAHRLFGEANPIGQTFRLDGEETFTVTGVMNRDSYRSHLMFDVLFSYETVNPGEWGSTYTYLRLNEGYVPQDLTSTLRQVEEEHLPSSLPGDAVPKRFRLQAVSSIPLSAPLLNESTRGRLAPSVAYFLVALVLIVLLVAGFNYVNLSTARSLGRAREVGVRKTVGAHRQQVMGQFVIEAVVTALLSFFLAAVFLQWLVPAFNRLSVVNRIGVQIGIEPGPLLYAAFLLFALLVGTLAGLYPAWHLSKFEPSRVLKASAQSKTPGFEKITLRKVLIIVQFAVAFVATVTASLFYLQAEHMAEAEQTGLRTDRLIQIELHEAPYEPFQQEAQKLPGVERIGGASHVPFAWQTTGAAVESDYTTEPVSAHLYAADYETVRALDLSFITTRNWSEERFESGQIVIINETAAREFRFEGPQNALGQPLSLVRFDSSWTVRIAGVVQDFYVSFTEEPTRPVIFHYNPDRFEVALAQVVPGREQVALEGLTKTWSQFDPTHPATVDRYEELLSERTLPLVDASRVLALVAGLAILISCLGLLGIATYTVQSRTREIGIRKALGATVEHLVSLLSKDFLWLVGTAVVLGLPVAWWINRLWLQDFHYRIDLGVGPFLLSAAGLLALALLAIGSQTVRAARTDPATTLRDE